VLALMIKRFVNQQELQRFPNGVLNFSAELEV